MRGLLRKEGLLTIALAALMLPGKAQFFRDVNRADHDDWHYYFGLSISYNSSDLHTTKSSTFMQNDSVLAVEPGARGGIALGLLGTLRLSPRLQLRFNPQLIIGGSKYLSYTLKYPQPGETATVEKYLPSTIVSFPLAVKLNSDRINNFRMYMLAGIKYDIDLASASAVRNTDDIIKLNKYDYGLDFGIGANFYLRYVTFSPEIRFSHGLGNLLIQNPALKFSSVFDRIQSRMIFFTINLED